MFKKAERKEVKLKLAMSGPSGSGKTFSALRLAVGLGGKIAVIDTENGSASLYSDRFDFDVIELDPPFTNEKYINAIQAAVNAKYDVLVIDSLTHQWAGEGGLLNKKEQMDARGGNSYTNWAKMTPEHEKFKSAILHSDIHVIGTLRSKQDYVLEQNDKGKSVPKKVGLAPVQRDGMEYEFTTVFDIAMDHNAQASKDRTGLFTDKIFQIEERTGKALIDWLRSAKKGEVSHGNNPDPKLGVVSSGVSNGQVSKESVAVQSPGISNGEGTPRQDAGPRLAGDKERAHVVGLAEKNGWTNAQVAALMYKQFEVNAIKRLTLPQYQELCTIISTSKPETQETFL